MEASTMLQYDVELLSPLEDFTSDMCTIICCVP